MKESNIPEYYKADIPFNPDIDISDLKENIYCEIKRHFPLWEDGFSVSVELVGSEHVYRILYGPKKRSDINMFAGLKLANIIRAVWFNLAKAELPPFPNGWGHKKDGSSLSYNELYIQED